MTDLFRKLFHLFDSREHRRFLRILVVMLVTAGISTVGVAAIMPFMSLIANPQVVEENRWLALAYAVGGFQTPVQFLMATGVATLLLLLLSNGLRAYTDWRILTFSRDLEHRLAQRLLDRYLSEPYSFFLNRNTATLSKNILHEAHTVVGGVLVPVLNGLTQAVMALFIIGLLIAVDVGLALSVAVAFSGAYGLMYAVIRGRQARLGRIKVAANTQRYKVAGEAFGGIKDVKVLGREGHFLHRFEQPSQQYARTVANNAIISALPKYALETIAFGSVLIILLYLLGSGHPMDRLLPLLSLYAFAAYRLIPSLQQLFALFTKTRFNAAALDDLYDDLVGDRERHASRAVPAADGVVPAPLVFKRALRLSDVTFTYPGCDEPALRDIDLVLPHNQTIGLVGPTGSGKTTLVDLILGLYPPDHGTIAVDGVRLDEATIAAWRRQVGYVPQQIFLSDDSVLNNIAFGLPEAAVDRAAAERAARMAQLHDFVLTLPDGYDTVVGERGVRLSGGQRQRIGIARALYHDPELLVMDEATSALDALTEDAVMDAIQRLAGSKTMVIIAHRLSTVTNCDVIYLVDGGRITGSGSYEELRRTHAMFRAMTGNLPAIPA